jgi:hypothetical protein
VLQELLERHDGTMVGLNWNWKCSEEASDWLRQWQTALEAGMAKR